MRIVLVLESFPLVSETFIAAKVTGLVERGLDVQVVCWRSEATAWAAFPGLAEVPGLRDRVHDFPGRGARGVVELAARTARLARRPATGVRYAAALARERPRGLARNLGIEARVLDLAPDLVHFEFGWLARLHGHLADVVDAPCTASFRGADLNYLGLDEDDAYGDVWPRLAAVHVLGDDLWRRALRRGCPPTMPVARIPPAVDVDRFAVVERRPRLPDAPLRVATVARLHWKKGFEHALEAVRRLRDRGVDVRYRIIGSGPHEAAVRACVEDLGLQAHVELLGARPSEVVRATLAGADVLLHAATSEGFGNAVLEAQAAEVPVVCTDADGLAENVLDGVTGFVVPRRDPGALAARVELLARDPGAARRMGRAGRQRVAAAFRPADQLDAFEAFYREVVAGSRSGP